MPKTYFLYSRLVLLLATSFVSGFAANAQLRADFQLSRNGGCSPLAVNFTNTSTGTTSNARYDWDFGNGTTSVLQNAGATYVLEKTYAVTLTVTDAGKTATQRKEVTVYKKPTVAFSFDAVKGCLPQPVRFQSVVTPGDGSISSYFWDYGDGATEQGSNLQKTSHIYNIPLKSAVGLTVTNSLGCYSYIQQAGPDVLPALVPAFTADKTVLCNITGPVKFTNNSTGPGTLTYLWDFGDGSQSTAISPSHNYAKKGTYTVSLTATSSEGCTNSITRNDFLNVRNYVTDFSTPPLNCITSEVAFIDKSSPAATSKLWLLDTYTACYYCNTQFTYSFTDTLPHTLQLINNFGTCKDTLTKTVAARPLPAIAPFIINVPPHCTAPVTVNFLDTSKNVTNWQWDFNWISNVTVEGNPHPSFTYNNNNQQRVKLTVQNKEGCSASTVQIFYTGAPSVGIYLINTNYSSACDSLKAQFTTYKTTDSIVSYLWDFGDGVTDISPEPIHTFKKEGQSIVVLQYKTKNGCTGRVEYNQINIGKHHPVDFTSSGTIICGNTPVTFSLLGGGTYNGWDFGDGTGDQGEYNSTITHQYLKEGSYTVRVRYASDYWGYCSDTVIKKDFIKVLPPFPKIQRIMNTCSGDRNLVSFTDTSYKAESWDWNFGDGTAHVTYNSYQPVITHMYAQTGAYKLVLTNSNGLCSVKDSSMVYVLRKQQPFLYADSSNVCGSTPVKVYLKNMETNPAPWPYFWYGSQYNLQTMEYGDGTPYKYNGYPYQNGSWQNTVNWTIMKLDPNKQDLRVISSSTYFDCTDTSNVIPLKVNGPQAGFTLTDPAPCFSYPVVALDTSHASNAPITNWRWDFGDNTIADYNKGGLTQHVYAAPGQYQVKLTVTDNRGCTDQTTYDYRSYANPSGPKAAFNYSPFNISPGSPVQFTNNSNQFGSSNTRYQWLFGDGSSSTEVAPAHVYKKVGVDTVLLIAINTFTGCQDTARKIIDVRRINTKFSMTKSFVSSSSCPPVIVRFSNTSSNTVSVAWDFGDGSKADNQNNPSHTYYQAGKYQVTMYGYGYNGSTDTTTDSIIVKAPSASLRADAYAGCLSKNIRLDATVSNANSFVWDFGDGYVQQTADSFSQHVYQRAGIYSPALILYDSSGCALQSYLSQKIIIDSLGIAIRKTPASLCGPGRLDFFDPVVTSFAQQVQQPLQFHWDFGTGQAADTANTQTTAFVYNSTGTKFITLNVRSPYGCTKQVTDSVSIVVTSKASIISPPSICEGSPVSFDGLASITDGNTWQWDFDNTVMASLQHPPPQQYADSGIHNVILIVNHLGCADTAVAVVQVHPKPRLQLSPGTADICLGSSVQLSANNSYQYVWLPATGLNNANIASPLASPSDNIVYTATATNQFGCTNKDSVRLRVLKPFTVHLPSDSFVCKGSTLTLAVSGAASYQWINSAGISDLYSAAPVLSPAVSSTYTVVGYDDGHCFTDTASVRIDIKALPTINAGPDIEALTGNPVPLQANGSTDIVHFNWSPADQLNCSNCASPVAQPRGNTSYIVTASNQWGCTVADTVLVKLTCDQRYIAIPNAFTPDNNSRNDVFYIRGKGVRMVRSFRVYGRWGELVFEKKQIAIDDPAAGWNGTLKGQPAPAGAYVYFAELICDTGELFERRGSVLLLR